MEQKTCIYCGNKFFRTYQGKSEWRNQILCSRECKIKRQNRGGGTFVDKDGYLIRRWTERKKVMKMRVHRMVMEEYLGRKLRKTEVVHHRDGDKRNNNIENLEVLPSYRAHNRIHKFWVGTNNPKSKLTREKVLEILGSAKRNKEIASEYGVSVALVGMIKRRVIWKDV